MTRRNRLCRFATAGAILVEFGVGLLAGCSAREETRAMSESTSARLSTATGPTEKALFGAGCFWGVEATFRQVPGVVETAVGYSGGTKANPTYEDVCSHDTGHAEVVEVTYDPAQVTYDKLLDVFWSCHDPTQVNRQGPDVGSNYRSVIFYTTPAQEAAAKTSKERLATSGRFKRPIATEITAASTFWRAEEYHQRYFEKHGMVSCHVP